MLLNVYQKAFLCVLLGISGISAVARVDNNWSHRRQNSTVTQNQRGQAGYRPAVAYQQPQNRTLNNYQPAIRPTVQQQMNTNPWIRNNQAPYQPQQPSYGQKPFNQTRPAWNQPSAPSQAPNYSQQPSYGQRPFNQTLPAWNQPSAPSQTPNYPQYPTYGQAAFNQTRPAWNQPIQPNQPNSNLYPALPNNPNSKPGVFAPSAPLQQPQNSQNWTTAGQAVFSYGPGQYPLPAGNSINNPPSRQGSTNPYANMLI